MTKDEDILGSIVMVPFSDGCWYKGIIVEVFSPKKGQAGSGVENRVVIRYEDDDLEEECNWPDKDIAVVGGGSCIISSEEEIARNKPLSIITITRILSYLHPPHQERKANCSNARRRGVHIQLSNLYTLKATKFTSII